MERSDQPVKGDAAGRLDQDRVPVAHPWTQDLEGVVGIGDVVDPRRVQPGRHGPVHDATGVVPHDHQEFDRPPRGFADRDVAGLMALPQFEHLPEDGHAPAGQAGEEVERREHRAR